MVTEFCARGSLYDVLQKAAGSPTVLAPQLDWGRRLAMALDAAKVRCCSPLPLPGCTRQEYLLLCRQYTCRATVLLMFMECHFLRHAVCQVVPA